TDDSESPVHLDDGKKPENPEETRTGRASIVHPNKIRFDLTTLCDLRVSPEPQAFLKPAPPEAEGAEPQTSPGPSRILHHITDGNSPLPSPRCPSLSQSQRFNTDPEAAPSPPCSQHFIMARGIGRSEPEEGAKDTPSVPLLSRHIQTLKRKIRRFEERFEQEMNYKPSHNDKSANPEVFKLMSELAKTRKQLKDLRLKQSVEELRDGERVATVRYQQGEPQQQRPALEETMDALLKRLRDKRQALGLPDNMKGTKQEKILVKPLYDRYQMVKHLLSVCSLRPVPAQEEEEGSDEEGVGQRPPPPCRAARQMSSEEESDSDPAFVSPLDEVKMVRQSTITMANLHEAVELLQCLRETRAEKKRRRKALKEFEDHFFRQMGRAAQKDDRIPMAEEYQEYRSLKAKLRLLEVLLSKQETTKTI
uniref:FAM13A-like domain-containing protein n=1 Tax=Denticeps clupeoides TaxID=299321 RepID=A0AAY4A9Z5_9TELE